MPKGIPKNGINKGQFKKGCKHSKVSVKKSAITRKKLAKKGKLKGIFKKGHKLNQKENHPNWKGGTTKLRDKIKCLLEYKQWRSDIFQRDNWTCQTCSERSRKGKVVYLEAHHIKEYSKIIEEYEIKTVEEALKCKELWDINNGITLCKSCHNLTKNGRKKGNKIGR